MYCLTHTNLKCSYSPPLQKVPHSLTKQFIYGSHAVLWYQHFVNNQSTSLGQLLLSFPGRKLITCSRNSSSFWESVALGGYLTGNRNQQSIGQLWGLIKRKKYPNTNLIIVFFFFLMCSFTLITLHLPCYHHGM